MASSLKRKLTVSQYPPASIMDIQTFEEVIGTSDVDVIVGSTKDFQVVQMPELAINLQTAHLARATHPLKLSFGRAPVRQPRDAIRLCGCALFSSSVSGLFL